MTERQSAGARILAVSGSPRKGGTTETLLAAALEEAAARGVSSDVIPVRDLSISPCREIYACQKTGECAIRDAMTPLYERLLAAPVLVLATPIFFYGPSAQLKILIDRCQALWARKYVLKRLPARPKSHGFLIAAGATTGRRLFDGLLLTTRYAFDVLHASHAGELLVRGVEKPEDLSAGVLSEARLLGAEMARAVIAPQSDERNAP